MESLIIGHILQYLLAGVGMWQMVTGAVLQGIVILLIAIVLESVFKKSTNRDWKTLKKEGRKDRY